MLLLDRYILLRFFANFAVLFLLMYVFGTAIDVIVQLDKFVDSAARTLSPDANMVQRAGAVITMIVDFQAPRAFQFYAYLHGLIAVGAMGFTLAQMHRHRELVAVMASGVSLYRVAMPFLVATFSLSVLQLLNQELILPKVAPLLLRDYEQIGESGVNEFPVKFTPDSRGTLLQAAAYDPVVGELRSVTILERDDRGRTARRITAAAATWSERDRGWLLTGGVSVRRPDVSANSAPDLPMRESIDFYSSDITPQILMVRRFSQYAAMLSMSQISQMLATPQLPARETLLRYRYSRFSSVLVNLLVMALALPAFLLREPANLLKQSVKCAITAIPASMGAAIGMMVEMPGIPPAASVFLPVIVLGFVAMFPWTFFKT